MTKQVISNFHTHTKLCNHAVGMPSDYVKQAEIDGCSALGFSDHCPYPSSSGEATWPNIRMTEHDAPGYIRAVKDASASVSFPVYAGFECEWDKAYESWYRDTLLGEFGAQYLVLGSHWCTFGSRHVFAQELFTAADLHRYIDQTIQGLQSGLFAFIAHPDIFMGGWKEWNKEAKSCLQSILDAAVDCSVPLEVNGLGLVKEKVKTSRGLVCQYPVDEFWQMVAESSARVICNADAHDPLDVIRNAQHSRDYAVRFGLTPLESIF